MFKSLKSFLPWTARTLTAAVAPLPSLEDAVNDEQTPRRMESIVQHGTKMPVEQFAALAMAEETVPVIIGLLAKNDHVQFHVPLTFKPSEQDGSHEPDYRERYTFSMNNKVLTVSHERLSGFTIKPYPQDASDTYREPVFLEVSRLTGVLKGDFAYVAARTLTHPYGAMNVMPAKAEHLPHFSNLYRQAIANKCESFKIPPSPASLARAALARQAQAGEARLPRARTPRPRD